MRGAWLGNRGILHADGEVVRYHASDLWITCALQFRDWRLPQWQPHHFTVLFFHDEAVSLAAGHRPCALCRRGDYNAFRTAVAAGIGEGLLSAKQLDRQPPRRAHRPRHAPAPASRGELGGLPSGTFVIDDDIPTIVVDDALVPWTTEGYGPRRSRPTRGIAQVLTPPSTVAALRAGYRPQMDASAQP